MKRVLYIYHLPHFWKDLRKTRAFIDLSSKINAMTLAYVAKLGLKAQKIDIRIQKIDGSTLNTFGMVLADFQVEDKLGRTWFF